MTLFRMRPEAVSFFIAAAALLVMSAAGPARAGDARFDIPYGRDLAQRIDVIMPVPPDGKQRTTIVYFHGGAWALGSRVLERHVGRALAEMGYVAVLVDYRLFPFARFPTFVQDGAKAVRWARDNAKKYGIAPNRIYLMGHSAGAHISMLLALDPQYLRAVGVPRHAILGAIGLAGPYAKDPLRRAITRPIFAGADRRRAVNPISVAKNVGPRLLLMHGGADLLVPPHEARRFGRAYRAAGGTAVVRVYPGAGHWQVMLGFEPSQRWRYPVYQDVKRFVGKP